MEVNTFRNRSLFQKPRLSILVILIRLLGLSAPPLSAFRTNSIANTSGILVKIITTCVAIAIRIKRLDAFVAQQYETLKKDANLNAAQVTVAIVNPASLLFLDGTYGHKTAECGFGRLKGKAIAMRCTAAKKACPHAEQYRQEADLIEKNQYHFGIPDFETPVQTDPSHSQEDTEHE